MNAAVAVTIARRLPVSGLCAPRKQIKLIQCFWPTIFFPGEINHLPSVQIAKHMDAEAF
jgi:hypothetical protein